MGTDVSGRICLDDLDKVKIQDALSVANQKLVEIRAYIQTNHMDDRMINEQLDNNLQAIILIQGLPTCSQEDTLIKSAKYAARQLQKATGETVYI